MKEISKYQTIIIRKILLILLATFGFFVNVNADNYPLGNMTCDDIGDFAAEALMWRKRGFTPAEALKKLDELNLSESVDRQNMLDVLKLVYGGYGNSWTQESARKAITQDCQRDR
tara:strand:- start:46 stop:390 length:345 start_codon:yes stop_codon:yes gene_type:complete